ncbi:MAG: thioesterase superfamily protein [Nevskia sp.]|nr:thioesterase superfamily protein [Nevskia sp.]
MQALDPDYASRVRDSFARQGAMALLGAFLHEIQPGRVEIDLPYRPELSQQHGYFHAGMVATVADSAGGYAAYTLFPAESSVLTVEFKVNLIAPADGERVRAVGQVIRSGRTLTICELKAYVLKAGKETQCLHGMATLMCLAGRSDAPSQPPK